MPPWISMTGRSCARAAAASSVPLRRRPGPASAGLPGVRPNSKQRTFAGQLLKSGAQPLDFFKPAGALVAGLFSDGEQASTSAWCFAATNGCSGNHRYQRGQIESDRKYMDRRILNLTPASDLSRIIENITGVLEALQEPPSSIRHEAIPHWTTLRRRSLAHVLSPSRSAGVSSIVGPHGVRCIGLSSGARGKQVHSDRKAHQHAASQRIRHKCSLTLTDRPANTAAWTNRTSSNSRAAAPHQRAA